MPGKTKKPGISFFIYIIIIYDEPSHNKIFDTHAYDYNSRHVKHLVRLLASSI